MLGPLRPRLFGFPFVVALRRKDINVEAVTTALLDHMAPYTSLDRGSLPFRLLIVDASGRACGICPWNKFCPGCPFTTESAPNARVIRLGLQWSKESYKVWCP